MDSLSFWRRAWSASWLSGLFIVLYGACNNFVSIQNRAQVIRFHWETSIPFIAWMIIPYMSLDLFFVLAPLLAKTKKEIRLIENRIGLSILLSCLGFFVVPLKCISAKPEVSGAVGWVFSNFLQMDKPYNQLPSLHIVLSILLCDFYMTKSKGLLRGAIAIWFSFIAASTLLTFQHHFVDVLGGALVGLFFLYLFPNSKHRWQLSRMRIGLLYGLGGMSLALVGVILKGWGYLLLWPALNGVFLFFAYYYSTAKIFPKHVKHFKFLYEVLLFPLIVMHRLSHLYYSGRSPAWNKLTDNVWIGRLLFNSEANAIKEAGVGAVVDLSGELSENPHFSGLPYLNMPILDLTAPDPQLVKEAIAFIETHSKDTTVYIHCKAGYSRTAALAGCWLLETGRSTEADHAIKLMQEVRPNLVIRPEAEHLIRNWNLQNPIR